MISAFRDTIVLSLKSGVRSGDVYDIRAVDVTATDSGKDRMVAYNDSELYVRYPLAPIVRQTPYYQGITFAAPYVAALGAVEFVYPETAIYQDGL